MSALQKSVRETDAKYHLVELFEQVAAPLHADAQMLIENWRAREADGGFVVGRDIPSRSLARILRNIAVSEPIGSSRNPDDVRIRLAGDAFRQRFGRDTTGAHLSELLEHDDFEAHISQVAVALHRGAPYIVRSVLRRGSLIESQFEVAVLPVWSADRKARWVLTGIFYFH